MTRTNLFTLAAAAVVLAGGAPAHAEAPGAPQPPAKEAATEYKEASQPGPQAEQPRRNVIQGTVATIDRTAGVIALQPTAPDARPIVVQFAPGAVKDLKPGDAITLRMTYSLGSPPPSANGESAGDAPRKPEDEPVTMKELQAEMGQAIVTGTVSNVDPNTGELDLRTDRTVPLHLQFAPAAVAELKTGQTITVDMGFTRQAPAPEPRG